MRPHSQDAYNAFIRTNKQNGGQEPQKILTAVLLLTLQPNRYRKAAFEVIIVRIMLRWYANLTQIRTLLQRCQMDL